MKILKILIVPVLLLLFSCDKDHEDSINGDIIIDSMFINDVFVADKGAASNISLEDTRIRVRFHNNVDTSQFQKQKLFITGRIDTGYHHRFVNRQVLLVTIDSNLEGLSNYRVLFDQGNNLGGRVSTGYSFVFSTKLDSTPKFPLITDDSLLTLVQKATLGYFWDYGHPVSGLTRDRFGGGDVVTSGGSGFGVMAIITGIERGFISRADGFERINKMVNFLINPGTEKFHGAFPHWLNGSTGKAIPFSTKDNGGDLVETAFLMEGLLTARQYFSNGTSDETSLRDSITALWERVEWDWYQKGGEDKLYWHWSPNYAWEMNMPVTGWNEALLVYILAAASPTHTISKAVYDEGWARNGAIKNGNSFFGIKLPLGESYGGPMFFEHYSFLALDPRNLSDQYADYHEQNTAHAKINYEYCKLNPKHYPGYSGDNWGLTASDIPNGYTASSPTNDIGVIAPTAALSSFPYTPAESMAALKFFYYILGDKLWGEYGFYDSFSLKEKWFASSYLAIDQGPVICMIENYRSGVLWELFMSDNEIKAGLTKLEFNY
jgi:hypothetical protein